MFIYLPGHGDDVEIIGKLISISAITEIKIVKDSERYHVKIFYWQSGTGKLGEHTICSHKDKTDCQNYIESLSQKLPSITLMGAPNLDKLVQ